jgi:integrase
VPNLKLNDAVLQSLKADRRIDFWDISLPSFGVRVGAKTKTFIIKRNNRRIALGRYPRISLSEARTRAKTLLYDSTYSPAAQISLEKAIEAFAATHCKDYRPRSKYEVERILKKLVPIFSKKLSRITTHDVHDIIDKQTTSEANHLFKASRTFFRWCVRRRHIDRSPLDALPIPNKEVARARVLTDAELKSIWEACERSLQEYACELELGVWPACRPSTTESTGENTEPKHFSSNTDTPTGLKFKSAAAPTCELTTPAIRSASRHNDKLGSTPIQSSNMPTSSTRTQSNQGSSSGNPAKTAPTQKHRDTIGTTTDPSMSSGSARSTTRTSTELGIKLPAHFCTIVKLLILTGQRRGEIAALRADFFSKQPDNSQLSLCTLPPNLTKNGREHTFPIGPIATSILRPALNSECAEKNILLFPARGKISSPFNGWSKSKAALDDISQVRGWCVHDLRRSFATNLARLGTPIHIIERLLNHKSGSISGVAAVYNRYDFMTEMREAIDKYDQFLLGIGCGR